LVILSAVSAAAAVGAATADAAVAPAWKNCTRVNKTYPHGVGEVGARDHTSGTAVTNFKRSNALYRRAMNNNRGLDRDKDGIACESA
jgi:hypothetical protein